MDVNELHTRVLYPVTRVRAMNVGGSGVLVYSQPDTKNPGDYINIALTCEHVVDDCINIKEEWDPVVQKNRKKDVLTEVHIEVFAYAKSKVLSTNSTPSDIIAYDKAHDMAAVKLHDPRPIPFVASIIPKSHIQNLRIGEEAWVCGCSLGHDPFPGRGELTYLREMIDQKAYIMANAPAIFGNSGGGLFQGSTGHLLGLTSRVTVSQMGFGYDVQTWMEFTSHPDRLYEFMNHHELQFIYDPTDDYYSAMDRREKRRKEALREADLPAPGRFDVD